MVVWDLDFKQLSLVVFFPDGRVFAEYQVLLPHPTLPDRYVEAVQVWGFPEKLRGDVVLAEWLN